MNENMSPVEIKKIRNRYGLSQQSFARVLGIGEASMVRYENGQPPTRANANLIRAAANPSFMLDCLERDGERIPERQREQAEEIIYAEVRFDEKGKPMTMTEIYSITLQQEILNEQAAGILADLYRLRRKAEQDGDDALAMLYEDVCVQIWRVKDQILDAQTESDIAEVRGRILGLGDIASLSVKKAA